VIDGLVAVVLDAWLEHAAVSRTPTAAREAMTFTPLK
jgi:hypothetical protein